MKFLMWRYFGSSPKYCREKGLGFHQAFKDFEDNIYLHGYWQSEKYFSDVEPQIREDFKFPEAKGRNKDLIAEIQAATSVSLHVRRGDYLNAAAHTVCSQAYYTAAVQEILNRIGGAPIILYFRTILIGRVKTCCCQCQE